MAIDTEAPLGSFEEADKSLRKQMSFTPLLFLSLSAIIGSGWLFAVLAAAGTAGPAAIISWILGGIFVIFIALSYAEIAGMLPRSGAIVRYPHITHGAYTGWIIGWAYWLSAISVPAIEAEAVVTFIGGRFKSLGIVGVSHGITVLTWWRGITAGIVLMAIFFLLNYFGIRLLAETNRWITWWKLIIPTLTFILLFFAFRGSNLSSYGGFFPLGHSAIFSALSSSGIVFAYLGFRQALDYAGEARNPQRDVPRATIGSVVIAMVLYTALQIAFLGSMRWGSLKIKVGDWAGLSGSAWASGPLYQALHAANIGLLGAFASLLLIDSVISPSGTGWVYLGTATRTNYGLSVDGYGPKSLQAPNRHGIPWVSLAVALVIGCLFFVPAPSWYELVGFITSATALTYIMGGMSLPIMRRYAGGLARPFRLRAAGFWAPLGFLAAVMVVYWSGYGTLLQVYGAVFIGLPLFVWYYAPRHGWINPVAAVTLGVVFLATWVWIEVNGGYLLRVAPPAAGAWSFWTYYVAQAGAVIVFSAALWALSNAEGKKHVRSVAWLIFLLFSLLVVSYYGAYGPLKTPDLKFPYDTLAALVVGIVAYYWGVASGFETEEMREIVRAAGQKAPAAR
ncbi:MAG: APC family permease [Actinomycetes bacterium]